MTDGRLKLSLFSTLGSSPVGLRWGYTEIASWNRSGFTCDSTGADYGSPDDPRSCSTRIVASNAATTRLSINPSRPFRACGARSRRSCSRQRRPHSRPRRLACAEALRRRSARRERDRRAVESPRRGSHGVAHRVRRRTRGSAGTGSSRVAVDLCTYAVVARG